MNNNPSERVIELLGLTEAPEAVEYGPNDAVSTSFTTPYPPDIDDLARIYSLAKSRKITTALEFGSGYSTVVLAAALEENRLAFGEDPRFLRLRRNDPFSLHTVDCSVDWLATTMDRVPAWCADRVKTHHSNAQIGTFAGRICHYYESVPNVCPDFIYLDGPMQHDVDGSIDGIDFRHNDRTVVAADIARMEWLLLPGTMILVDGRTNNARFLKENFQREWSYEHDAAGDVHMFELIEKPLGDLNKWQIEFCLSK